MFICIDEENLAGYGKSLDEAWSSYQEYGCSPIEDCSFFESERINVELKIHRVESVVKTNKKP